MKFGWAKWNIPLLKRVSLHSEYRKLFHISSLFVRVCYITSLYRCLKTCQDSLQQKPFQPCFRSEKIPKLRKAKGKIDFQAVKDSIHGHVVFRRNKSTTLKFTENSKQSCETLATNQHRSDCSKHNNKS